MKSKESEGDEERTGPRTEPWGISALRSLGKEKELAEETEEGPVKSEKKQKSLLSRKSCECMKEGILN